MSGQGFPRHRFSGHDPRALSAPAVQQARRLGLRSKGEFKEGRKEGKASSLLVVVVRCTSFEVAVVFCVSQVV